MREKMQRFDIYMKNKGLNDNQVTLSCGLSQGLLGQARAGKSDLGKNAIDKILNVYQDLSRIWLLTGEGNMLVEDETKAVINDVAKGNPYYDVDFIGGFDLVMNDQTNTPSGYIDLPQYNKEGVIWCNITGHSMEPKISHGDIIAIKEVVDWQSFMSYGEVYAIVTKNDMRTVKIVRKGSDDEHLRLVPINERDYDEQTIEKGMIERVFSVLACMKKV